MTHFDAPRDPHAPTIVTHRTQLLLSVATLALMSLIFAPISLWPVAFVCLVPWLILVGSAAQAPRVYLYSYVMALAFFLLNMRWLYPATGPGYFALSVYQAAYFPLVACPVRSVVRRRHWPLAVVLPVVWVGSEMLRAVVISGFPWFFLAHSVHGVLTLIQVSDLVGAYGVSFVIATVNGAIADMIHARLSIKSRARAGEGTPPASAHPWRMAVRSARFSAMFAAGQLLAIIIYGQVQLQRDTITPGPKIAVLQGDFVNLVQGDEVDDEDKQRVYFRMLEDAAVQQPDLYLLPETPWIMYLNPEARNYFANSRETFTVLRDFAQRHAAYLVTGSASYVRRPTDLQTTERRYNSAMVFHPDGREPGRYDKVHLVYFGEIVPFRFGRFHSLYLLLNSLMPFSGPNRDYEYSLFPGTEFSVFSMDAPSQDGRRFRFGIPICYEDVMPYVSRSFVSGGRDAKRADLLLNISNDGWFGRGIQQPQHLAICVFRAVENRVGIARAVNTGVSGFIEPTGQMHDLVRGNPEDSWPGNAGYAVSTVGVDSRYSFYSQHGDWFAWGCAFVWLALFVDYWIVRVRTSG